MNRIEEAMKKRADELELEADKALGEAQKSPRTGIYVLGALLLIVGILIWAIVG
jgi:hypothetical protein